MSDHYLATCLRATTFSPMTWRSLTLALSKTDVSGSSHDGPTQLMLVTPEATFPFSYLATTFYQS